MIKEESTPGMPLCVRIARAALGAARSHFNRGFDTKYSFNFGFTRISSAEKEAKRKKKKKRQPSSKVPNVFLRLCRHLSPNSPGRFSCASPSRVHFFLGKFSSGASPEHSSIPVLDEYLPSKGLLMNVPRSSGNFMARWAQPLCIFTRR